MIKKFWFVYVLFILFVAIFRPLIFSHQIPFSSNLLASFFNPWAQEKFSGWAQGIPNKPVGIDDLRIFYPQRAFTIHMIQNLQIPFWNPYNFSGNYHAGLSETAVFYPLFFLFLFLPQLPVWIILQLLEPFIAAVGMYYFLRLLFKSNIPVGFGAIVFGFSPVILVRMVEGLSVGHTLIWLPWVFFGIEAYAQKKKIRFLVITTSALCLTLLAGWFQYTFYIFFIACMYTCLRSLQDNKERKIFFFLPFFVAPILTLFHSVPALEALAVSTRDVSIKSLLDGHLMPWYHVLTFLSPDLWGNPSTYIFFGKSEYKESILFIGLVPFVLSFFGLFYGKKDKRVIFFLVFALLGVLLGIDSALSRFLLSFPIPIVSSFLPNRIFIYSIFGLSILSAYGVSYLLEEKKISKMLIGIVGVVMLLFFTIINGYALVVTPITPIFSKLHIVAPYFLLQKWFNWMSSYAFTKDSVQVSVFTKNIILPDFLISLFVVVFLIRKIANRKIFVVGIFGLTIFSQVYFAQKYIPWSQSQFVFPSNPVFAYLQTHQGLGRFISLGQGYISSDIPLFFGLYSPDGVGSLYIKRYGELVTYVQQKGRSATPVPRIEIRINPTTTSLFTKTDRYMLRFMQIDSINHVVKLRKETDPVGMSSYGTKDFPLVWQNATWQIFSYKDALPHVFWTNQYVVVRDDRQILADIFDFQSSARRIVLEQQPSLSISPLSTGSVVVKEYTPQRISLQTHATGNGLIFLSDTYAPNFVVTIDGKRGEVLRADYAFRAVVVQKGVHQIVLFYQDSKETWAFFISGLMLVALLVGLYRLRRLL